MCWTGNCRAVREAVGGVTKRSRWGFWRRIGRLRPEGRAWIPERVHRVYCAVRLNLLRRAKKRLPTRIDYPLQAPAAHYRICAANLIHGALCGGHQLQTFNVIDESNREELGIELARASRARD